MICMNYLLKSNLVGQIAAALVVVLWGGVQVEFINLPFTDGILEFGYSKYSYYHPMDCWDHQCD